MPENQCWWSFCRGRAKQNDLYPPMPPCPYTKRRMGCLLTWLGKWSKRDWEKKKPSLCPIGEQDLLSCKSPLVSSATLSDHFLSQLHSLPSPCLPSVRLQEMWRSWLFKGLGEKEFRRNWKWLIAEYSLLSSKLSSVSSPMLSDHFPSQVTT